jgi:hypothetical protein
MAQPSNGKVVLNFLEMSMLFKVIQSHSKIEIYI